MESSNTLTYIVAFIVIAHIVVGFGYLMYKMRSPGSPPEEDVREQDPQE